MARRAEHHHPLLIGAHWLLSAKGKAIPFFGLDLPPLVIPDKVLGQQFGGIHEWAGTLGYWLIGLHAATTSQASTEPAR